MEGNKGEERNGKFSYGKKKNNNRAVQKNVIFQLKKGKETKSRKRYDNHVNKKDACIMNLSIYKGIKGNKYE